MLNIISIQTYKSTEFTHRMQYLGGYIHQWAAIEELATIVVHKIKAKSFAKKSLLNNFELW